MKILWFSVLLYTVFADPDFGSPYLRNSNLCNQWSCVNRKLGLPYALPLKEDYATVLRSLLPEGGWQQVVDKVLDSCYGVKPRRYINTCPGQAMLHCVLDHLIQMCPEASLRKDDACAPLSTIAGFKYMFSQSRYENLEKNLPSDRRPAWFLRNYFSSKCCNLPQLFNSTALGDCGFDQVVLYYTHTPRPHSGASLYLPQQQNIFTTTTNNTTPTYNNGGEFKVNVVDINLYNPASTTAVPSYVGSVKVVQQPDQNDQLDPLDCCDVSDFIKPPWRSECAFQLSWSGPNRLTIRNDTRPTATPVVSTTAKPLTFSDVKVVPLSCEKETCIFRKLNVVSESGAVDRDAFLKLLDNMTSVHDSWTRAKGRVVTNCLSSPGMTYFDDCEINKVLRCTFDVLSENCPFAKKHDPCKRRKVYNNGTICQINTSDYRPKNRRQFCSLPSFVNHEVLSECGATSLSRLEYVDHPVTSKPRKYSWWTAKHMCKESTPPTKCLLNKMGVLNKYGFMDYFRMKDRIRQVAGEGDWASFTHVYLGAFSGMPMYNEHCSTAKKLLNVVDAMVMTCPASKRKRTLQCQRLFTDMANTPHVNLLPKEKHARYWSNYHHVFLPRNTSASQNDRVTPKVGTDSLNDLLNSDDVPKVRTIDIKPQSISKKPALILPVYLRTQGKGSLSVRPYRDGVLRRDPYALHHQIAGGHIVPANDWKK